MVDLSHEYIFFVLVICKAACDSVATCYLSALHEHLSCFFLFSHSKQLSGGEVSCVPPHLCEESDDGSYPCGGVLLASCHAHGNLRDCACPPGTTPTPEAAPRFNLTDDQNPFRGSCTGFFFFDSLELETKAQVVSEVGMLKRT